MTLPRAALLRALPALPALLALLAWTPPARAQTCTVASATGVDFGTNLRGAPTDQVDVAGVVTLSCSGGGKGQTRRACLALGTDVPVPHPRQMAAGAGTLAFQLYDGTPSGPVIATSGSESGALIMERTFAAEPNTPVMVAFPIAARLFAGQTAAPGTYNAALTIAIGAGNLNGGCTTADVAPQPSTFIATAHVGTDCTLSIPDASFGSVTRLSSPIDTSTTATVTCSSGAPWSLSLDAGSIPGNTYAARRMGLGGTGPGAVAYQIYRDPGPANVWGNGTMGTVTRTGTGTGAAQHVPIYLRVPAQGPQPEGTYSDRVTATLTF